MQNQTYESNFLFPRRMLFFYANRSALLIRGLVFFILVLIGLDLLIAMNHYHLFFTVLGIEILAGMLIGWIVFIILERRKQADLLNEESSGTENEE